MIERRPIMQRVADWLVFAGIMLFLLYVVLPSSLFLRVEEVTYTRDQMVIVRSTPFGQVTARWETEILPTDPDSPDCSASGTALYQPEPRDTVTLAVPTELQSCLDRDEPRVIRDRWTVLLLGLFPLRPTTHTEYHQCCKDDF